MIVWRKAYGRAACSLGVVPVGGKRNRCLSEVTQVAGLRLNLLHEGGQVYGGPLSSIVAIVVSGRVRGVREGRDQQATGALCFRSTASVPHLPLEHVASALPVGCSFRPYIHHVTCPDAPPTGPDTDTSQILPPLTTKKFWESRFFGRATILLGHFW